MAGKESSPTSCSHTCVFTHPPAASAGPALPRTSQTTHRALPWSPECPSPPMLSRLSHARTCTIQVPLTSTSHYEEFTEKHDFKCHSILKLNKNKSTKCSRSNWQLVQSPSHAQLSETPWIAAPQAFQSFTVSRALLKLSSLHI